MKLWLIFLLCGGVVVLTHVGLFLWFARQIRRVPSGSADTQPPAGI